MPCNSTNTYTLQPREIKAQVPKDFYFMNTVFNGKNEKKKKVNVHYKESTKIKLWYFHNIHGLYSHLNKLMGREW